MINLWDKSIEIIKQNQSPNGAFIASPAFPTYHYSWFRDGSYIAYALDLAGEHEAAGRFFDWATWIVDSRVAQARRAIAVARSGIRPDDADLLDTRYTVDGQPGEMEWFNNQLDGFGTLLWAIERHALSTKQNLTPDTLDVVLLLGEYLSALWRFPCTDCWEEFPDKTHVATLSAIYGGLHAAARLLEAGDFAREAERVRDFVLEQGVVDGHLAKFIGSPWVDASLIHAATPYRLLEPDDPIMRATIAKIETDLRAQHGGLHRYVEDNYYGGGEWLLLTAYLGWYYVELGEPDRARDLLSWIESKADTEGNLTEQAPDNLIYPDMLPVWESRWGKVASPLVWSHAAYITLVDALRKCS
jgi:GH15 family glucan-1,4-alpha-glucosidase